jgi:hypothetical protein
MEEGKKARRQVFERQLDIRENGPLVGVHPKSKAGMQRSMCTPVSTEAQLTTAKKQKPPMSLGRWLSKMRHGRAMEY